MEKQLEKLNQKMNALLSILLDVVYSNDKEKSLEQSKVKKLKDAGMENEDIALVLNKPVQSISKLYYKTKSK